MSICQCPPAPKSRKSTTDPRRMCKVCTGCSQFPMLISPPIYRRQSLTSEDNWKVENLDSFTGSSSVCSFQESDSVPSRLFLAPNVTPSLPNPTLPTITSGRTTPQLLEPDLSWENELSNVTPNMTGTPSGNHQPLETFYVSPHRFEVDLY